MTGPALQAQTFLITGASGGIGLELAKQCAAGGHDLVLVARSHERLAAIAGDLEDAYNIKARAIEQDLSQPDAAAELVAKLKRSRIKIDGLINDAGFGLDGRFDRSDPDRTRDMMQLNMVALTELTRLLLPGMVERGRGRVLNLASVAAFVPGPNMAVYFATKAYVLSLSEGLAEELRDTGVTVSALCPGPTPTHFAAAAQIQNSDAFGGHGLTARQVAEAGYSGMMAGRTVIVPGLVNKASSVLPRWVPRALVRRAMGRLQGSAE